MELSLYSAPAILILGYPLCNGEASHEHRYPSIVYYEIIAYISISNYPV